MSVDEYLRGIIAKYKTQVGPGSAAHAAANKVAPVLRAWAGEALDQLYFSGSYAKGTAIHGVTDVDLFISLRHDTRGGLGEIYRGLNAHLIQAGHSTRLQNVSIGLTVDQMRVDLVPGRKQGPTTNFHSLYKRKTDLWTQTNVIAHIDAVASSGRVEEICLTKIWRALHGLEFPSFYLELTVLDALHGLRRGNLTANFITTLEYIRDRIAVARVVDPANTANVVSDDLTLPEKRLLAQKAESAFAQGKTWAEVVW